jgi:hypothetical protein
MNDHGKESLHEPFPPGKFSLGMCKLKAAEIGGTLKRLSVDFPRVLRKTFCNTKEHYGTGSKKTYPFRYFLYPNGAIMLLLTPSALRGYDHAIKMEKRK